jgi:hypothetical protein
MTTGYETPAATLCGWLAGLFFNGLLGTQSRRKIPVCQTGKPVAKLQWPAQAHLTTS